MEEEIAKYRKKKKSSVSKSKNKAKHKHLYKPCLLSHEFADMEMLQGATYCTICGKIGDAIIDDAVKTEDGYTRSMTEDELFDAYSGCPMFYIDHYFQRHVPITNDHFPDVGEMD